MKKGVLLSVITLICSLQAMGFEVVFNQLSYEKGNTVKVSFSGVSGQVGVENSIKNGGVSEILSVSAGSEVSLGTITEIGLYPLEFHHNDERKQYLLTVLPDQGTNNPIFVQEITKSRKAASNPLFIQFLNFLTADRMMDNIDETISGYLSDHPLSTSTTVIICGSAYGFPVLVPACINGSKDIALGFTIELMKNVVDDMPISKEERKSLKRMFSTLSLTWSLTLSKDKVAKVIEGLSYLTEVTDNETYLSKLGFDNLNNYKILIELKK